jgi:signal transduction histidine kinase
MDAEAGSIFLLDEEHGELYFDIALGEKEESIQGVRLKMGEGIAGWVAEHGTPLLVPDVTKDQRFCTLVDEKSRFVTRNLLCVPLTVKGKVIGALEAINKRNGIFSRRDQAFLGALAHQVAIALENARLYEENSRQLSAIIDQERRHRQEKERLVKDLHDGIGGIAANINLLSEIARRSSEPDAVQKSVGTIADLSREALGELRSFMNTLEAKELTWQDLAADIRSHGTAMLSMHGIDFRFTPVLDNPDAEIGMFFTLTLFRIVKETLANVVKHARAASVEIALHAGPKSCILVVADDGCGLAGATREGRGLRNIRSRAADLNAQLSIASPPGTRFCLTIPLPFLYAHQEGVQCGS